MKRREFLGAPVALLGLGLAAGYSPLAAAATDAAAASFILLRVAGSGGETDLTGDLQQAWPQLEASLDEARINLLGVVRSTGNTLGAIDIESAFFGEGREVNLALVYSAAAAGRDSGSRPISFLAQASSFAGFVVSPQGGKLRSKTAPSVNLIGDARDGRLVPGHYILLHRPLSMGRFNLAEYRFSGSWLKPLARRDRKPVTADYIVFAVDPA